MQITWFGHAAFRLDFKGQAVLIDPFFTGNPAFASDKATAIKGVSHILLTHGHGDHSAGAKYLQQATVHHEIAERNAKILYRGTPVQSYDDPKALHDDRAA